MLSLPVKHLRRRTVCLTSLWLASGTVLFGQSTPPQAESLEAFQGKIRQHVSQERFAAAQWGIKVVSLDTGKVLCEQNADKLLKPASNAKLYTGALALDRLGPDYRIKTSFYAASRPNKKGVLEGDLIVYGRGDPSFAARFHDGDYSKSMEPLVEAIVSAGVKRIKGRLVGDESFFRGPPFGSGWTWNDLQYYYGAQVSALTVEDNVLDLVFRPAAKVGEPCSITKLPETGYLIFSNWTTTVAQDGRSWIELYRPIGENVVFARGQLPIGGKEQSEAVAVFDPAEWFVALLSARLQERGVRIGGTTTVGWLQRRHEPLDPEALTELASVESPPLPRVLEKMMKPSQNLYAQLLLLQVGAKWHSETNRHRTTETLGLQEMKRFLAEAGIDEGTVLLEEGSGLSRGALLTPAATVRLLQFMDQHACAEAFRKSLPLAGVDGTLRSRFKGTAAEGHLRAKTGTLRYVHALSGYATSAGGERLVFSIMLNNYDAPERTSGRGEVDAVALMLVNFAGRSGAAEPEQP